MGVLEEATTITFFVFDISKHMKGLAYRYYFEATF